MVFSVSIMALKAFSLRIEDSMYKKKIACIATICSIILEILNNCGKKRIRYKFYKGWDKTVIVCHTYSF